MCGGPPCKDFLDPQSAIRGAFVVDLQRLIERVEISTSLTETVQRHARRCRRSAAERIAGLVERTPLIESEVGGHANLAEMRVSADRRRVQAARRDQPPAAALAEERKRGVVAFSSGNHARGVAIAARRLGIRAIIVMPADAPQVKVEGTRAEGAEIVFYDRRTESREAIAARIADETGATVVPSFDDPAIVAGQGTAGLEIVEQLAASRRRGSSSRAAVADWRRGSRSPCPDAEIVIVEPEGWDDMAPLAGARRDRAGRPPMRRRRFCDALQTPRVSPITFGILRDRERDRRCRSATTKSSRRDALRLGAARAGRRAGRRGGAGGVARGQARAASKERSSCCRAGMSIRRFMRGSSATRLRRRCVSCIRRARGGPGSSARPPGSALRARRRAS